MAKAEGNALAPIVKATTMAITMGRKTTFNDGGTPKVEHGRDEHGRTDYCVEARRNDACERNEDAWEIDLGEKIRAVYEAGRGLRHPRREKRPWQEGSEAEERVGNSLRRHLGEVAEEHGENDRRQERLKECPG